jgi:hypothetical protein
MDQEAEQRFTEALKGSDQDLREQITLGLAIVSAREGDWARVAALTGVVD